jgi:hypothetical protein
MSGGRRAIRDSGRKTLEWSGCSAWRSSLADRRGSLGNSFVTAGVAARAGISLEPAANQQGLSLEQLGARVMNSIIYIVGLVVIVVAVLSFFGLR